MVKGMVMGMEIQAHTASSATPMAIRAMSRVVRERFMATSRNNVMAAS